MTAWARYTEFPIDSFFHVIVSWNSGGSVVTACFGRWTVASNYEVMASPPHDERCEACSRNAIDRRQVERGLKELERNAPRFDLSDAGGVE